MTPQEIFDKAATHLLTQGERSEEKMGHCKYRGPRGLKCAVGCFIPDTITLNVEVMLIPSLIRGGCLPGIAIAHINLLVALQSVHDKYQVTSWAKQLRRVAENFGLSDAVVTPPAPVEVKP